MTSTTAFEDVYPCPDQVGALRGRFVPWSSYFQNSHSMVKSIPHNGTPIPTMASLLEWGVTTQMEDIKRGYPHPWHHPGIQSSWMTPVEAGDHGDPLGTPGTTFVQLQLCVPCRCSTRPWNEPFRFRHAWAVEKHGSLNVPIEHHPTIRYMVYNGYYKVMSNIPKMGHLPTPEKSHEKPCGLKMIERSSNKENTWVESDSMSCASSNCSWIYRIRKCWMWIRKSSANLVRTGR